jgi:hypothetical protein
MNDESQATVLTLPSFIISCIKDKVVILRTAGPAEGEGGLFDLKEFDEWVNKFFNDRF